MSAVETERDGEVFVLRMRAGENRLNRSLLDALNAALDEVEASTGPAALVTTGDERFYSTGLDLDLLAGAAREQVLAFLNDLHRLFARLLTFPTATVAAVNGHAFAAGAMLALAQDFRIMRSDKGYVCFPEVDLGTGRPLTPGMYALLSARLAPSTVHEALVTGRRYGAAEAAVRGLVDEAQADGDVLARAVEVARGLATKDRATMAAIKRGLYEAALQALERPVTDSLLPG